jgi:hypothetical protein
MALIAAVVCNILFGPIIGLGKFQTQQPHERKWPDADSLAMAPRMAKMADRIPPDGPVATGFRFISRAADRHELHSLHHIAKGTHTYSTRTYPVPDNLTAIAVDTADWRYLSFTRPWSGARLRESIVKSGLEVVDAASSAVLLLKAENPAAGPFRRILATRRRFQPGDTRYRAVYNRQLALEGFDPVPVTAKAGKLLPVNTYWRRADLSVPKQPVYYGIRIRLMDQFAQPASTAAHRIGYTFFPVHDWQDADMVRVTTWVILPDSLPSGNYSLWMSVHGTLGGGLGRSIPPVGESLKPFGGLVPLGEVRIEGE